MLSYQGKIRLSHSAMETLVTCERKFQLDRLLVGTFEKRDTVHTVFGKAFGEGVASYMLNQDADKALYKAFLAYNPVLEDDLRSETSVAALLLNTFPKLDDLLQEWDVASFQDKPAVELSFRLNINDRFYWVGYIDLVLRNKFTGRYGVMENKTTALQLLNLDPLYMNSGQALGYSIVLDQIVGEDQSEYDLLYLVGQLNSKTAYSSRIHALTYPKTILDRLNWFISLGMDVQRIEQMLELNVFPLRGKNCLQFMRPCVHLGTCHLHGLDEYKLPEEDTVQYQFVYELDKLVEQHMLRIPC